MTDEKKKAVELQTRQPGKTKGKRRVVKTDERFREFVGNPKTSSVRESMNRLIENGFKFFSDRADKRIIQGHNSTISAIYYDQKSKMLITADDCTSLLFWNTKVCRAERVINSDGKNRSIMCK
mmetsp:Transcript_37825/g.42846  ORF Transcript_37825/g.42846 Transcript_37825/m.42846 type:complete len:123 (+) Transcript_37825:338-706(+)